MTISNSKTWPSFSSEGQMSNDKAQMTKLALRFLADQIPISNFKWIYYLHHLSLWFWHYFGIWALDFVIPFFFQSAILFSLFFVLWFFTAVSDHLFLESWFLGLDSFLHHFSVSPVHCFSLSAVRGQLFLFPDSNLLDPALRAKRSAHSCIHAIMHPCIHIYL